LGERLAKDHRALLIEGREQPALDDGRTDLAKAAERPAERLRRLHEVFAREVLPEILAMPTRANPAGKAAEDSL